MRRSRWSLLGWFARRRPANRPPSRWRRRILIALTLLLCVGGLVLWRVFPLLHYKVRGVAYSPDGKWLAMSVHPGGVKLRGPVTATLNVHGWNDHLLAFSPDSEWLATAGTSHVYLWELKGPRPTAPIDLDERVCCLGFIADGKKLLAVTEKGQVFQWTAATRKQEARFDLEYPPTPDGKREKPVRVRAILSADGETLVWCARDGEGTARTTRIFLQSLTKDRKVVVPTKEGTVLAVAFSADGKRLVWGGFSGRLSLADLTRDKEAPAELRYPGVVYCLAFSPDGKWLAVGNGDGELSLWATATQRWMGIIGRHWDNVYSVAWSPDGRTIATGSRGRNANLWDVSAWTRP